MGINRTNLNSSKETRWQSGIPRCTGFSFFSHNSLLSCNSTIKCNNITNVTFNLWHLQLQSDNHNSSQCPLCQFPCVSLLWQWCVCALPVWQSSVLTLSICYYSEHLQTSFSSPPSSLTSHCPHKFQTEFAFSLHRLSNQKWGAGYLRVYRLSPEVDSSPEPSPVAHLPYCEGTYILWVTCCDVGSISQPPDLSAFGKGGVWTTAEFTNLAVSPPSRT